MDIQQTVIDAIAEVMGIRPSEINTETTKEDLMMDSLDELETVMCLEQDCGVEIDDNALDGTKTVGDMVALIARIKGVN